MPQRSKAVKSQGLMLVTFICQAMQMTGQGRPIALLFALLMLSAGSAASPQPLQPGDYATADGWGELSLQATSAPAQLRFNLQTVTSDHVCSIEGLVETATGIGLPSDAQLAPGCTLQLRRTANGIQVDPLDDDAQTACRHYCGANGSYEGHYLAIAPACTWQALDTAKTSARAANTQAQRQQALARLSPLLTQCTPTLPLEQAVDLHAVVAGLHGADGNGRACRASMARYAEDASRSQDDLLADASPSWGRALSAAMAQVRQALAGCPATDGLEQAVPPG